VLPEAIRHGPSHLARLAAEFVEGGALAALDGPDDFDEQLFVDLECWQR
jgi:hypothetical protein